MNRRHALAFLLVIAACVGCDHASKRAAEAWLAGSSGFALAFDTIQFQLAFNQGAFLSLGENLPEPVRWLLLVAVVPLLIAFVCLWFAIAERTTRGQRFALALISGGGIGNWLDRVRNDGAVTDFVSLGIGGLRTGIFNVADLAVMAGVCLLLFASRRPADERASPARG